LPDLDKLRALESKDARKYSLSNLPEKIDPRLKKAIGELSSYEIRFGYFNGHLYISVLTWGKDWYGSQSIARQAGGHLVSITSKAENKFVYKLFSADDRFVDIKPNGRHDGPWIGLVQDKSGREPKGGWRWVTGEPLSYKNWQSYMPGNYGGNSNVGQFWAKTGGIARAKWRDQDGSFGRRGFVMEVE
jgi:hypothetical protein